MHRLFMPGINNVGVITRWSTMRRLLHITFLFTFKRHFSSLNSSIHRIANTHVIISYSILCIKLYIVFHNFSFVKVTSFLHSLMRVMFYTVRQTSIGYASIIFPLCSQLDSILSYTRFMLALLISNHRLNDPLVVQVLRSSTVNKILTSGSSL